MGESGSTLQNTAGAEMPVYLGAVLTAGPGGRGQMVPAGGGDVRQRPWGDLASPLPLHPRLDVDTNIRAHSAKTSTAHSSIRQCVRSCFLSASVSFPEEVISCNAAATVSKEMVSLKGDPKETKSSV